MSIKATLVAVCLSCIAMQLKSQQSTTPPTHQHQHTIQADMIDGKDHPEQIPDQAAYGLFLRAISSPTQEGNASQAIHCAR